MPDKCDAEKQQSFLGNRRGRTDGGMDHRGVKMGHGEGKVLALFFTVFVSFVFFVTPSRGLEELLHHFCI